MQATTINKSGKTEKNKKIKAGDCVFPFKYKWKTHEECIDSPKGEICATEINPKTRTLTKYGYCIKSGFKKGTEKKARFKLNKLNTINKTIKNTPSPERTVSESPSKLKLRHIEKTISESPRKETPSPERTVSESPRKETPSPERTVSESPSKLKLRHIKKTISQSLKKKKKPTKFNVINKTKKKTPSPQKQNLGVTEKLKTNLESSKKKTPSPQTQDLSISEKLTANQKSSKNKTLKKMDKTKFKLKVKKTVPVSDLKTGTVSKSMEKNRRNEKFIDVLSELNDIMMRQGEPFRAKAYREAAEAIMTYDGDITSPEQLKGVRHIGKTIMSKLNEFVDTGTLKVLERERTNPLNELTKVYGVGPKKAKEFIAKGITTIEGLEQRPDLTTANMKIGIKYFDDIETRIPRAEIDKYKDIITPIFNKATPEGSTFEIVGSYRRGANNSGDIDIIVTNDENNKKAFTDFLDKLIEDKIVIEVLSRGKSKSLTIAQIPGHRPRRVDLLYAEPDEYAFAILYFTGSRVFNTVQRQRALDLQYSLNEHGLYHMINGKKGSKIQGKFPTEKSIFDFLGMEYREPKDRINSRSVKLLTKSNLTPLSPKKIESPKSLKTEQNQLDKTSPPKKVLKKRKLTLKKSLNSKKNLMGAFRKEGLSALKMMTEEEVSKMIRDANDAYYGNKTPLLTDNEYDILREHTLEKYPNNEAAKEGHTQYNLKVEKNKVTLPYQMWSMDKIKPDTGALDKWKAKYSGPYVLSCKLDGVSGLYSTEGDKPKLYTRGNGIQGQDVSHLIPYLKLPKTKDIVIRGEFIIPKEVFQDKYSEKYSNPRNFIAGKVNQKTIEAAIFKDIDFVAYEVIKPELVPSQQMSLLTNENVDVVRNLTVPSTALSNELLSALLQDWRNDYKYEIDGVICIDDKLYSRTKGNPDHAFAFKMVLSDQIAEAKVLDVIWTPSKDGFLKPRVQIEPVILGGAKIEYATGFNGKFIEENKIGVGALISLVRSGDVIPHIVSIIQPAEVAQMPNVPYKWNETHVDIELKDKSADRTVQEKTITAFFRIIGVEGLSSGNVKRIMNAGYKTIPEIIALNKDDFLQIEGFKDKLATKISTGIKTKLEAASLPEIMHATNIFGRGFGTRRLKAILDKEPDILVSSDSEGEKYKKLLAVPGMAKKSVEKFLDKIPFFRVWMQTAGLTNKLEYTPKQVGVPSHPLFEKKYVMTGTGRDKALKELLTAIGAEMSGSVSKNVEFVVVGTLDEDTGKADDARKLNIPLLTPEQVIAKYFN